MIENAGLTEWPVPLLGSFDEDFLSVPPEVLATFMKAHQKESFLAYLSFYTVHTPIQACKRHVERYEKKLSRLEKQGEPFRKEREGWTKLRQDGPDAAARIARFGPEAERLADAFWPGPTGDSTA